MDDRDVLFRQSILGSNIPVYQGITKRKHIQRHWQEKQNFFGGIAFMNKHAQNAQKVM